jgi:hypothetical protein
MSDEVEVSYPEDTMRERRDESRIRKWVLIDANRLVVAAGFLLLVFGTLMALHFFAPGTIQKLNTTQAVSNVFGSVIIVVVTGVTLVLTIAQLVISREVGPLSDQRQQMTHSIAFRDDVGEMIEPPVSPPEPSAFLRELVAAVTARASTIEDAVGDDDSRAAAELRKFAEKTIEHGEQVQEDLAEEEFGSFEVIVAALNYNYSWKMYAAQLLDTVYGDDVPEEAEQALDEVVELLSLFGPAREHFKTLYFQWEVIELSKYMLYTSMFALGLAAYMVLVFDPTRIAWTFLGADGGFLLAATAFTLTLTPFGMLLSSIMRMITVTKRTLASGPFILRKTQAADALH